MMTIKDFSRLCRCGTQTLRYYDKVDLLKPVKVDPWSGYRYYTEEQAIDFVKIKNLQAADFTIDEIKTLLAMPDAQVYAAFDRKIEEQAQKLERIKEIQRSYLTEKNDMEKLIHGLSDFLTSHLTDFALLEEFGLTPEDGPEIVARIRSYMENMIRDHLPEEQEVTLIVNDQVFHGADHAADAVRSFTESSLEDTILLGDETVSPEDGFAPDQWETLWERRGWSHVREFIGDIPPMADGRDYCFHFRLAEGTYKEQLEFPLFMIGAMLPRVKSRETSMSCSVDKSGDGQNHFALLAKK